MDLLQVSWEVVKYEYSTSSLAPIESKCDEFGKNHCVYNPNQWAAWIYFALGLLLMIANVRNLAVLTYILRRHWVNTDAICLAISVLNALHGTAIVTRSAARSLRNLWPYNQLEVRLGD